MTASVLPVGADSITAAYSGDSNFMSAHRRGLGDGGQGRDPDRADAAASLREEEQTGVNRSRRDGRARRAGRRDSRGHGDVLGEAEKEDEGAGTVTLVGGEATLTLKAGRMLHKAITLTYSGDAHDTASTATPPVVTAEFARRGPGRWSRCSIGRVRIDAAIIAMESEPPSEDISEVPRGMFCEHRPASLCRSVAHRHPARAQTGGYGSARSTRFPHRNRPEGNSHGRRRTAASFRGLLPPPESRQRPFVGPGPVERIAVEELAVLHHVADRVGVVDVLERVLRQHDEVGELAGLDAAKVLGVADRLGAVQRGGAEDFQRLPAALGPAPTSPSGSRCPASHRGCRCRRVRPARATLAADAAIRG